MNMRWGFIKDERVEKTRCLDLQEVVNMSDFWLHIHSAILYGLMTGDPESINVDHCMHYIELGKKHNVTPVKDWLPPREYLVEIGLTPQTFNQ